MRWMDMATIRIVFCISQLMGAVRSDESSKHEIVQTSTALHVLEGGASPGPSALEGGASPGLSRPLSFWDPFIPKDGISRGIKFLIGTVPIIKLCVMCISYM